jgi:hypothetical protein
MARGGEMRAYFRYTFCLAGASSDEMFRTDRSDGGDGYMDEEGRI